MARFRLRRTGLLPGFGLSLGFVGAYLGLLVLVPLGALALKAAGIGPGGLYALVTDDRALAALRLSFGAAFIAAALNAVFGVALAWVLVRQRFLGHSFVNALVDLPFALPTAVAGIALTAVYSEHGVLGAPLQRLGIRGAFSPFGVVVALTFVGLPFVVRTVQPVLEELDPALEEAASVLGATPWQSLRLVVLPALAPSVLTGFALAFARAIGEYGSVVFISGNMPMRTEIVPLLIVTKLEQYDYQAATALALVMLTASFGLLLLVNLLGRWAQRGQA
ncbi:MAG: sulfate ABC transporter permease subunit CysT [Myxococcales bacterium]|nr:sulfate ABC transporter permease subunit CysT [Myxococcales bacterium]